MVGIVSFGGYVPRLRLQRSAIADANSWLNPALKGLAKGERAIANWDEDSITMAVEASRDALGDMDRSSISAVFMASTSFPFADRQNSGIVKEALNLADATASIDISASQRAGTSGLAQALHASAGSRETILYLASEKRLAKPGSDAEMTNGDGAAALVLGSDHVIADFLGVHSVSVDFVDHYRGANARFDYNWETRWIRDEGYNKIVSPAIAAAFAKLGLSGSDISHFVMPCTFKGVRESIARKVGIRPEAVRDGLGQQMGEAGTAHSLVMLVDALQNAKAGQIILVIGFGQGCDVLAFRVTEAINNLAPRGGVRGWLGRRHAETNYTKFLFWNGLVEMETGIRAEVDRQTPLTVLYRNRKTVLGLVGGRNPKTGSIQFPKSEVPVNVDEENSSPLEDYPLADLPARILTYTSDHLAYTAGPPSNYGMVQFEGGGRMNADFSDMNVEDLDVDRPVRMMFRIKNVDQVRGFTRYFWKAVPAVDVSINSEN